MKLKLFLFMDSKRIELKDMSKLRGDELVIEKLRYFYSL